MRQPTEGGWYWTKKSKTGAWIPAFWRFGYKQFVTVHGNGQWQDFKPKFLGPKIDEPSADSPRPTR